MGSLYYRNTSAGRMGVLISSIAHIMVTRRHASAVGTSCEPTEPRDLAFVRFAFFFSRGVRVSSIFIWHARAGGSSSVSHAVL